MRRKPKHPPMPAGPGRPKSSELVQVNFKLRPQTIAKLEELAVQAGSKTRALENAIEAHYGSVPSDLELAELLVDRLTMKEMKRLAREGTILASAASPTK